MHRLRHLALHGFSAKIDNARAKKLSEATLPALRHLQLFDNTFRRSGLKTLLAHSPKRSTR